jgi:hypothetical protein
MDLTKSQQRAAKAAGSGLLATYKTPRTPSPVAILSLEVIDPLLKIEPDDSITGTMPLRLAFIAKWAQWQGGSACSARGNRRGQQDCVRKRA